MTILLPDSSIGGDAQDGNDNIYNIDGTLEGLRTVTGEGGDTLQFRLNDLTPSTFLERVILTLVSNGALLGYETGSGDGGITGVKDILFNENGMFVQDSIDTIGLQYLENYAPFAGPRGIPDVEFVQNAVNVTALDFDTYKDLTDNALWGALLSGFYYIEATGTLWTSDATGFPFVVQTPASVYGMLITIGHASVAKKMIRSASIIVTPVDITHGTKFYQPLLDTSITLSALWFDGGIINSTTIRQIVDVDNNLTLTLPNGKEFKVTGGVNAESQVDRLPALHGDVDVAGSQPPLKLSNNANSTGVHVWLGTGTPVNNLTPLAKGDLYIDYTNADLYIASDLLSSGWKLFALEEDEINIYNDDGTLTGPRIVTGENNDSLAIVTYDKTQNDFTEAAFFFISESFAEYQYVTGDGAGGVSGVRAVRTGFDGMEVLDTLSSRGLENFADYSDQALDNTLITKFYVIGGSLDGQILFHNGDRPGGDAFFTRLGPGLIELKQSAIDADCDFRFLGSTGFLKGKLGLAEDETVNPRLELTATTALFISSPLNILHANTASVPSVHFSDTSNNTGGLYVVTADPTGSLTPAGTGYFAEDITNGDLYISIGTGISDWRRFFWSDPSLEVTSISDVAMQVKATTVGQSFDVFKIVSSDDAEQLRLSINTASELMSLHGNFAFELAGSDVVLNGVTSLLLKSALDTVKVFTDIASTAGPALRIVNSTVSSGFDFSLHTTSPIGVITPSNLGELLLAADTGDLWQATGTATSNDWVKIANENTTFGSLTTQIIFNDGGTLTGEADFTWDEATQILTLGQQGPNSTGTLFIPRRGSVPVGTAPNGNAAIHLIGNSAKSADIYVDSRSDTVGVAGIMTLRRSRDSGPVTTNDILGSIFFEGYDGTDQFQLGAYLRATVTDTGGDDLTPTSLLFGVRSTTGSVQEKMRLLHDGKLGVGTQSPEATLHVVTSDATVTPLGNRQIITETAAGGGGIAIMGKETTELSLVFGFPSNNARGGIFYFPGTGNGMQFRTNGGNTRMSIKENGNVGVNQNTPLSKLDVNGSLGLARLSSSGSLNSFEEVVLARAGGDEQILAAAIVDDGTGYTVLDLLTISGGSVSQVGKLSVTAVSGGVITGIEVSIPGIYQINPTNPVSVTGGTGSGATFDLTFAVIPSSTQIQILTIDMVDNRVFWVQDETGVASVLNPITVKGQTGTINGEASILITVPYGGFWVRAFGGNLFAIG